MFLISVRDVAPRILLICCWIPSFIRPKAPTTARTILLVPQSFLFQFSSCHLVRFVSIIVIFFFAFFDNNDRGFFLYCLIGIDRKIPENRNTRSLNYIYWIMCSWFYPVVITDIPLQILTFPVLTGFFTRWVGVFSIIG